MAKLNAYTVTVKVNGVVEVWRIWAPTQCSAQKYAALVPEVTAVLHVREGVATAMTPHRIYEVLRECGHPLFAYDEADRRDTAREVKHARTHAPRRRPRKG